MSKTKSLRQRFSKTALFKTLLGDDAEIVSKKDLATQKRKATIALKAKEAEMAAALKKKDAELTKKVEAKVAEITAGNDKKIEEVVKVKVTEEIAKEAMFNKNEAMRYRGVKQVNSSVNPDRKPGSDATFSMLRRIATVYPIARACINRRIRQITQLEWNITTVDEVEDEAGYKDQIKLVTQFLKNPMGHKTRFREFLSIMVDDILTIDATSFEFQKTRGGELMYLVPVDPTTIALRVTVTGGTPEPPEPAYVQIIEGHQVGEFTTDEMIYESMASRSFTPYGLAPLESLLLQSEAAIRGTLYNLDYFRENNIPEGFITLPEEVANSPERIEEWQEWFDAIMAGDRKMLHRLKILPGNSVYTAAKKPEDMSFERFELWLLQLTCAVFDVPPQDIGITYQVNKSTAESQGDLSRERGLIPLGNLIKEILDDLIQTDLGLENLQFQWGNINPTNRKEEVDIATAEIKIGAKSVDEYRIEQGLEPIGATHMIYTSQGAIRMEDIISGKNLEDKSKPKDGETEDPEANDDEETEKMAMKEVRKWRKCVMNDLDNGKSVRTNFETKYLYPETKEEIAKGLKKVNSRFQADLVFNMFLDPELRASMTLLKFSRKLREAERDSLAQN